jgi:hypothetical protein
LAPARLGVDRSSEDLLARAALAGQEDGRLELGGAFHHLEHADHRLGGSHDRPFAALHLTPEELVRAAQPLTFACLADREQDLRGGEGLGEVVVRAPLHGLDGEVCGAERGHHDHGGVGQAAHELWQELDAVHARHAQIAEHHVHGALRELSERLVGVLGTHHLVALGGQDELQALPQAGVVVHDEDAFLQWGLHPPHRPSGEAA